jgi:hypothetical protein
VVGLADIESLGPKEIEKVVPIRHGDFFHRTVFAQCVLGPNDWLSMPRVAVYEV